MSLKYLRLVGQKTANNDINMAIFPKYTSEQEIYGHFLKTYLSCSSTLVLVSLTRQF